MGRVGFRSPLGPRAGYGGPSEARFCLLHASEGGSAFAKFRDDFVRAEASAWSESHKGVQDYDVLRGRNLFCSWHESLQFLKPIEDDDDARRRHGAIDAALFDHQEPLAVR
jgi:hypothetical protein